MSSIVDSQVFITSSITDIVNTQSQNYSIIRAIVQKINNNNQDLAIVKDSPNQSVSTRITCKCKEYLLKAQGNQAQGIANITIAKADLITSKDFTFNQLQQAFIRILSYKQQKIPSQATYYTNQGRVCMRLKIFLSAGNTISKSTAYSYSKILMRNFEQFVVNVDNYICHDGNLLINKEKQLQIQQQLSLATIMNGIVSSFNINDQKNFQEENRMRKKNQKSQMHQINSKIVDQRQMDDQINGLFTLLPSEKGSSWLKKNFVHIGENFISKYTNSLQLIDLSIKKREDYCYNMIRADIKEKMTRPKAEGGSCLIYLNKISGIFLQDPKETKKNNEKIQKIICFKSLKPQYQKTLKSKMQHEKQIVSRLKNSTSMFLPKYYGTVPQSQFSNSLLMQYLHGEQLDAFLKNRSASISLPVKLYLLLNIVYCMLELLRWNIVHLDLKPLNIIITKGLVPKLIDYGESYHKEICSKGYIPGFTFPYAAPQVYKNYEDAVVRKSKKELEFNQKQDVFAFGFIMREVLFGHLPFQLNHQKYREVYYNKTVSQRIYEVPESLKDSGDTSILQFLVCTIDRCIDPIPNNRPNFDWIGSLLKIALRSLKNN